MKQDAKITQYFCMQICPLVGTALREDRPKCRNFRKEAKK